MADSTATAAVPTLTNKSQTSSSSWIWLSVVFFAPIAVSLLIYRLDEFDAAQLPDHGLSWESVAVPKHYDHVLSFTERIGEGLLSGPEDIAYDGDARVIYTSCDDGWIKRVTLPTKSAADAKVESWVHVGGRPLGLAFTPDKELIVAESNKGLMKVNRDKEIELLTNEADGLMFRLTDGVDVAENGMIYFTDASYKYNLQHHMFDILEGRPYGRLLSFDPLTRKTQVLLRDLYFANGVAVSPQQDSVVFCETSLRRCRKYYIEGDKKGSVEDFVDRLPGYPDNIRYDGEGKFWIALVTGKTFAWDSIMRYPSIRKTTAILAKHMPVPHMQREAGPVAVNLDGEMISRYSDSGMAFITVGVKIEEYLYYGSLVAPYMSRVNLTYLSSHVV